MQIAVLKETTAQETRVAATPETVKKLVAAGHTVVIESGAGVLSAIPDQHYVDAGAQIAKSASEALQNAKLVLKVRGPVGAEVAAIPNGAAVIAMFAPYHYAHFHELAERDIAAFSLELIPRTTRAQSMDVLSSQANIGGYKAVLLATQYYPRFMPMFMTSAGTVKPAKVLILGAGVAGLQAIATAKRLGAVVEAFDVRHAAKEQVESLGGKFIEVPVTDEEKARANGVYATEMSEDYKRRQAELVDKHARAADIVITTALIPGKPAPKLLSNATIENMKPGSVVVDMAVEMGGNCALSKTGEAVDVNGVTILGPANLPGLLAADASALLSRNILNFLNLMLTKEAAELNVDLNDDIINATLVTHDKEVRFWKDEAERV